MNESPVPYSLRPKATKLPEGPDDSLEPAVEPVDAETRSLVPFDWAQFDKSKGGTGPPDAPLAPPATDPALRSLPPFDWPSGYVPGRPLRELVSPVPDLDPDIALWGVTILQRWPFTGHPTVGIWPQGWVGVDNKTQMWACSVGGQPGTWIQIGAGGGTIPGGGSGMPISDPTGITTATITPDPIPNANSQLWVVFPRDQSALAWGLEGNSFPSVVMPADPTDFGALLVSDGSVAPTDQSVNDTGVLAFNSLSSNRGASWFLYTNTGTVNGPLQGPVLGVGAVTVLTSQGPPIGILGGETGDVVFAPTTTGTGTYQAYWRCIDGGDASTAEWKCVNVIAFEDPLSAFAVPANPGILWHDFGGSGSIWLSTGTSAGDWSLIGGDTGWIALTLINSWTTATHARYRKLNGVVYVDFQVQGGSASQFSSLPAGFRPGAGVNGEWGVPVINSTTTSAGFAEVNASGSLFIANPDASTPSSGLGYISFIAEQ